MTKLDKSGLPIWIVDQQESCEKPNEPLPEKINVTVVGAGISGLSVAWWLNQKSIETIVLDRGLPGYGASGRNAGLLLKGVNDNYSRVSYSLGSAMAKEIWQLTTINRELIEGFATEIGVDCEFEREGSLSLASTEPERDELLSSVELLKKDGFEASWFSEEQVKSKFGLNGFKGAKFEPSDAALDPYKLVKSLADQLCSQGVQMYFGVDVKQVSSAEGQGLKVETDKGEVKTEMVVYATNAFLPRLQPFFQDKIIPVRGQMIALRPANRVFRKVAHTNFGYDYWRQNKAGNLIFGGKRYVLKGQEIAEDKEEINPKIHQELLQFRDTYYPSLKKIPTVSQWSGIMGFSCDGLPILGALPGCPQELVSAGFTGRGMGFAFVFGKLLSEIISGEKPSVDISLYSARRFI